MTNSALIAWTVIYTIARILTGEISVVPQAALPVANAAYNRLDAGKGYDGWHAIADEPADWALDAAEAAYWMWVHGETCGDIYALSKQDMIDLGFDPNAPWWTEICSDDGKWCSYVGREWR